VVQRKWEIYFEIVKGRNGRFTKHIPKDWLTPVPPSAHAKCTIRRAKPTSFKTYVRKQNRSLRQRPRSLVWLTRFNTSRSPLLRTNKSNGYKSVRSGRLCPVGLFSSPVARKPTNRRSFFLGQTNQTTTNSVIRSTAFKNRSLLIFSHRRPSGRSVAGRKLGRGRSGLAAQALLVFVSIFGHN